MPGSDLMLWLAPAFLLLLLMGWAQPRDLGRGGGWIGAEIGSRRIAPHWIRRLLAVVLAIAGTKLALI